MEWGVERNSLRNECFPHSIQAVAVMTRHEKTTQIDLRKVNAFINRCKRDHATTTLQALLEKVRGEKIRKYLQRFSQMSTSRAANQWIDRKEAQVIYQVGVLGGLDDTVTKSELRDLRVIVGYSWTGPKACRYLVEEVLKRKNMRAEQRNRVRNDSAFVEAVVGILQSKTSHPPKGFSVTHDGSRHEYTAEQYLEIAGWVRDGSITLLSYDYDGEQDALKRQSRGVHMSNKNWLAINRKNKYWKSTVVHEATHAIQDWHNVDGTVGDWEVAAHLAQAVRVIQAGGARHLQKASSRLGKEALASTAQAIVSAKSTYHVSAVEQQAILKVIREGGYGKRVDEKRSQSIFNVDNFLEFWGRIL